MVHRRHAAFVDLPDPVLADGALRSSCASEKVDPRATPTAMTSNPKIVSDPR
jgi:hypothetical protein